MNCVMDPKKQKDHEMGLSHLFGASLFVLASLAFE